MSKDKNRRRVGGTYDIITFKDYPDYEVIELHNQQANCLYCVINLSNDAITAHTNWFASFVTQLSLENVYDCILLPGVHLIEKELNRE